MHLIFAFFGLISFFPFFLSLQFHLTLRYNLTCFSISCQTHFTKSSFSNQVVKLIIFQGIFLAHESFLYVLLKFELSLNRLLFRGRNMILSHQLNNFFPVLFFFSLLIDQSLVLVCNQNLKLPSMYFFANLTLSYVSFEMGSEHMRDLYSKSQQLSNFCFRALRYSIKR